MIPAVKPGGEGERKGHTEQPDAALLPVSLPLPSSPCLPTNYRRSWPATGDLGPGSGGDLEAATGGVDAGTRRDLRAETKGYLGY